MSVSVSRSVAYLEQGRSTCSVSRPLSVELLAVRWPACLQNQLKVSARVDPSRPLSSSFLLCNARPSVRLTMEKRRESCRSLASSLAKAIENLREKSMPGEVLGHPKSIQNRSQDPLGTHRGVQKRPEGVSGASWERLGASPARPGSAQGVLKGAPGRQKGRPGALGSALRRPKSTPSRVRERKNRVFLARRVREASSERFSVDFLQFLIFL